MLKRFSLGEGGDTIVEVMIVLAVLGLAIGISYATANRSLLNARQAQENSQASELVQSQVEQLRTLSTANCGPPPATAPPVDTAHCIYGNFGTSSNPFCLVADQVTANTNTGCSQAGESGRYSLSITRQDASYTFTVIAKWPDVLGEGTDTVTMIYQLPPGPNGS
jgi:type II secretory pathway pseudopilin PulG